MYSSVLLIPVQIQQDFERLFLDNEELSTAWPKQAENLKNILHSKGVLKDEQFADG